jgi:hypothetical protein
MHYTQLTVFGLSILVLMTLYVQVHTNVCLNPSTTLFCTNEGTNPEAVTVCCLSGLLFRWTLNLGAEVVLVCYVVC